MTKEEVEYNQIDDRQRKRRINKIKIYEVDDGKKWFLEWIDCYKESDESKKVLKRRNSKFFSMCKAFKNAKASIPALPERELCKYEKIRENNIKQLKKELTEHEAKWETE